MNGPATGAGPRAVAARSLDAVLHAGRRLDQALAEFAAEYPAPARAQAMALAWEATRWHCRHRAIVDRLLTRRLRRRDRVLAALLSVALAELEVGRAPDYAAVSAAVAASRLLGLGRAAGLVNAALRRYLRERESLMAAVTADPEARWAHPRWLIDALRADWPRHWEAILAANQQHPPMWLRVNVAKTTREAVSRRLAAAGLACEAPVDYPQALRLIEPRPVEDVPGFADGLVSVQDAGAQLAAGLLAPAPGMRVLDACAAPGGKTAHLLECAAGDIDLLALDIDAQRLARVAENLSRLALRATLRAGDLLAPDDWWDGQRFDRILLDLPCSASGVLRRQPDIRFLRRASDIPRFARRQRRLLDAAWSLLAPGGRLLYASCSVLRAENQAVLSEFLAARADARECDEPAVPSGSALRGPGPGWQLLPADGGTDGFYYALIEKRPA
ncbi:MAG: 16S rRNA (cytosine(967)-C(5))-methyltransferase RsmB [Gammaproteobacteria bacterium]|nr:MAG: 16S rRNA (cytosine(967)-C(5))-methyltransferase RsmB [Gammaproteobacteria bacterium]